MNRLQIKKLEVLSDMVVYYSQNPSERRNATNAGGCFYKSFKSTSQGCAIGRHCSDVRLKEMGEGKEVDDYNIYLKLPLFLRTLGREFLQDLQTLHDSKEYWTESSLSSAGFTRVKNIVKRIEERIV